jgi:protein SCO1/2
LLAAALLVAVAALVLLFAQPWQGSTSPPQSFDGAAFPATVPVHDFSLTDQDGRPVSLTAYRGKVVILTFLDSASTTDAPLVAQQIRGALDELGQAVPALAVSSDPWHDTPAGARALLARLHLSGRMRFLFGPVAELQRIWHAYGVQPRTSPQSSAAAAEPPYVLLLDRSGRERVGFPESQLTPESIAHDVLLLQSR